jgi:hypothetical protein
MTPGGKIIRNARSLRRLQKNVLARLSRVHIELDMPEKKSRTLPRTLRRENNFTSIPPPIWNTPVEVPVLPGFTPPNSGIFVQKAKPSPALTHGERPAVWKVWKRLARIEGIKKNDL